LPNLSLLDFSNEVTLFRRRRREAKFARLKIAELGKRAIAAPSGYRAKGALMVSATQTARNQIGVEAFDKAATILREDARGFRRRLPERKGPVTRGKPTTAFPEHRKIDSDIPH
jgi:hypothetical protein